MLRCLLLFLTSAEAAERGMEPKETTLERADFYAGWSELSGSGRAELSLVKITWTSADKEVKKEICKHLPLLFHGYRHYQLKSKVSSF